jgi:beta-lactamase regulating signal transducer with metallopeptidase domain
MLAFCLVDGSVLSAPYDPQETRRPPGWSSSNSTQTQVLHPTVPSEPAPAIQSTIRASAPQVPSLPSDKETRSSQGKQNRSLRPSRWIILAILLILWLLGFLGHIGGSLIHFLLLIAVIALVYNLVAGWRSV